MLIRALAPRIDAHGLYQSPNVCFIEGDEEAEGGEGDGDDGGEGDEEGDLEGDEDAGEGDEEGEEADGEGDGGEGDEEGSARQVAGEGERPRRRTSDVIREEKRERKEAQRKADDAIRRAEAAERRAEELERRANERRQTETAEQERERVALMTPEERFEYQRQQDRAAHQQELGTVRFEIWDGKDATKFERLCDKQPLYEKVRDKVETEYERLKAAGRPVSRELLANQEIAKMVIANSGKARVKQKARGEERIRSERARPVQSRSGAQGQRQRRGNEDTPEARRRRLEGVTI